MSLSIPNTSSDPELSLDVLTKTSGVNLVLHFGKHLTKNQLFVAEKPSGYILLVKGKDRQQYSVFKVSNYDINGDSQLMNPEKLEFEISGLTKEVIAQIPDKIMQYHQE